jgi:hypothetical protein
MSENLFHRSATVTDATQYTDKQLTCADCKTTFVHSAQSQAKFAELGFQNEPKRLLGKSIGVVRIKRA